MSIPKIFFKNIRIYNSALSFASMNAEIVKFKKPAPFCYKVHGQIYHAAPKSMESDSPIYAQLYFLDSDSATNERKNKPINADCIPEVIFNYNLNISIYINRLYYLFFRFY